MEIRYDVLLIIVGCGVVTLLPRIFPLVFLRKFAFPQWYQQWLSFLPVTIMAGLVAQQLIPENGNWGQAWPNIAASACCVLCAVLSRSLFATVLCGIGAVIVLTHFY